MITILFFSYVSCKSHSPESVVINRKFIVYFSYDSIQSRLCSVRRKTCRYISIVNFFGKPDIERLFLCCLLTSFSLNLCKRFIFLLKDVVLELITLVDKFTVFYVNFLLKNDHP